MPRPDRRASENHTEDDDDEIIPASNFEANDDEDLDEERFYSLVNPAFVDDESNTEEDGPEWTWLHDFFPSDTSRTSSPPPPTPPPRSSSIETPKKEITIVVHLVSTPTKSQQQNLPSTSQDHNEIVSSQNLDNFDLINRTETVETTTTFPVPDLLSCHSRNVIRNHEGCFNSIPSPPPPTTAAAAQDDLLRHHLAATEDKSISNVTSATDEPREVDSVRVETSQSVAGAAENMSTTTTNNLPTDYQQLQTQSDDEELIDSGFIPRFVRASMRRVRRFRLSTRQRNNSEETTTEDDTPTAAADTTQSTILQDTTIEISNTSLDEDDDVNDYAGTNDITDHEDSSEISSTITDRISESAPELPPPRQRRESPSSSPRGESSSSPRPAPSPLGTWPHDACFALAALGCTAGLFNICRFAVLCLQFGGPFLLQFLLLSILFGIPLFLFHVALGHYLGAGVMDMWRISPVFQGVGIALLAGQALIGLYSIVGVSWLFIYFRDSFVTRSDNYKWAQPFPLYRGGQDSLGSPSTNTSRLEETVPDYFSGVVLQRYNLSSPDRSFGHFKFQVAFNLAVVWMIIFVSLSKGLKSYGKVVFVYVTLAVCGLLMLSCQMFRLAAETSQPVLPDTVWSEFITNNQRLVLPGSATKGRRPLSGYQALRLATELLPATFAALGITEVSVFWSILAYFCLILFGIAQQLAVWHSVITGIIAINARSLKSWETTITFFTCAFGYILGLPLTTELGIWVVYFLDTVVGSGWWLALLHSLLLVAVLVVRGRPYNGETLANSLFGSDPDTAQSPPRHCFGAPCGLRGWFSPLLSFVWSVVLPVVLLILSVVLFRTSESGELYDWSATSERLYWPVWARELGSILQLLPVLVVPLVAMVQTCRYLANGPPDLFDRIELLYRPAPWNARQRSSTGDLFATLAADAAATAGNGGSDASDDPPPKYTPPPSYTTATGARIAKLLRESIRRSMRRLAAPSTSGTTAQTSAEHLPPPPDYASVLIEMRRVSGGELPRNAMTAQEVAQILRSSFRRTREQNRPVSSELLEIRPSQASQTLPARSKTLTAPEVAQILRSGSLRRSRRYQQQSTSNTNENDSNTVHLNQDHPASSNI
ncbi:hypothetical protein B566_EDAN006999 [Ephemera danica]|nr:hypothetical protein B566_EDAN006999 [Ephemera danica]